MTQIVIAPRIEDPLSDTEPVAPAGYFQIRPSAPYSAGGQWVRDEWSNPISFQGSPITVQLDPLVDIPYELLLALPDGVSGGLTETHEFRFVPASGSPLAWDSLTRATGPSGAPLLPDALTARVAALETAVAGGGGGGGGAVLSVAGKTGAVNLVIADISNTNDVGQAIVTMAGASLAARKAAVLAYLGAGTSGLTLGTGSTQAAQGNLVGYLATAQTWTAAQTFSAGLTVSGGTVNLPANSIDISDINGLQAALDTLTAAVAAINTALNDTPQVVYAPSGSYAPRRATVRPQIFATPEIQPTNDGSLSGGGNMISTYDFWVG